MYLFPTEADGKEWTGLTKLSLISWRRRSCRIFSEISTERNYDPFGPCDWFVEPSTFTF